MRSRGQGKTGSRLLADHIILYVKPNIALLRITTQNFHPRQRRFQETEKGIQTENNSKSILQHFLQIRKYGRVMSVTTDGVWIGNQIYSTFTNRNYKNYDGLTELHTPKITVTTAHIKSSQSSLAVAR
jgi:hypothetical protein